MPTAVKPISEVKAELDDIRARKAARMEKESKPKKKDWYGLVYCDSNGYASIIGRNQEGIWLGKSNEFIPFLKSRGITGENVDSVLSALEDFRAEQKNQENSAKAKNEKLSVSKTQSCHSATKKPQRHISLPPPKPNRATFSENSPKNAPKVPVSLKNDKKLSALLLSLVNRDIGIPTIHRELNEHGYAVPYRTVGRWVAQMRSRQLL